MYINQRSCTMKMTTKYNLKRGLVILGLGALTLAFTGCEKDDNKPTNPGNPQQPQKHNVELKYDGRTDEGCVNLAMDTICKYNADPTVDTIFMIPEPTNQFATWSANEMRNVANYLRPRHNVNPNKVFGKGDLVLNSMVTDNCPEIIKFFADTLKYNVKN